MLAALEKYSRDVSENAFSHNATIKQTLLFPVMHLEQRMHLRCVFSAGLLLNIHRLKMGDYEVCKIKAMKFQINSNTQRSTMLSITAGRQ